MMVFLLLLLHIGIISLHFLFILQNFPDPLRAQTWLLKNVSVFSDPVEGLKGVPSTMKPSEADDACVLRLQKNKLDLNLI